MNRKPVEGDPCCVAGYSAMEGHVFMAPIEIRCSVKGVWAFMNPPGHHPDAQDFVAVDEQRRPYPLGRWVRHLFWTLPASDAWSWEKRVYAPFDGEIVAADDGFADRRSLNLIRDGISGLLLARRHDMSDLGFFLGNHLILRADSGIYALLAHLRQGSIHGAVGTRFRAGAPLAAIGNSGNTLFPHLHLHLMAAPEVTQSVPLPFVFTDCAVRVRGQWTPQRLFLPRNGQVFRFEAVG